MKLNSRKLCVTIFLFVLPILLNIPFQSAGHIVSDYDEINNIVFTPKTETLDQSSFITHFNQSRLTIQLAQINNSFMFDSIMLNLQITNATSNFLNSTQFYDPNLRIELFISYSTFDIEQVSVGETSNQTSHSSIEIGNETHQIKQKDYSMVDYTTVIDPAQSIQGISEIEKMIVNSTQLDLMREHSIYFININVQLKFSYNAIFHPNLDLTINSSIQRFKNRLINSDLFHNKITGSLNSNPVLLHIDDYAKDTKRRIYVPIPRDLTSGYLNNTLRTHYNTSDADTSESIALPVPEIKMQFKLIVSDLTHSSSMDEAINLSFSYLKGNDTQIIKPRSKTKIADHVYLFEYSIQFIPGVEHILEFELFNLGGTVDVKVDRVVMIVPPLFYEPQYTDLELIWIFMVTHKFMFIGLGTTVIIAKLVDDEEDEDDEVFDYGFIVVPEGYIREKRKNSLVIDASEPISSDQSNLENDSPLKNRVAEKPSKLPNDSLNPPVTSDIVEPKGQSLDEKIKTLIDQFVEEHKENILEPSIDQPITPGKLAPSLDSFFFGPEIDELQQSDVEVTSHKGELSSTYQTDQIDQTNINPSTTTIDESETRNTYIPQIDLSDPPDANFTNNDPNQIPQKIYPPYVTDESALESDHNTHQFDDNELHTLDNRLRTNDERDLNETNRINQAILDEEMRRSAVDQNSAVFDKIVTEKQNSIDFESSIFLNEEYSHRSVDLSQDEPSHWKENSDYTRIADLSFEERKQRSYDQENIGFIEESAKHSLNLNLDRPLDDSFQRIPLERQLDKLRDEYTQQKASKVIPDVDTIEEIWDLVLEGMPLDSIRTLIGIDRSYIYHLMINMMHLNVLINSLDLRKKFNRMTDQLAQLEKEQMGAILNSIYDSLVFMSDQWTSDDVERVIKAKDLTVRDEYKLFPNESSNENEDQLALSIGKTNLLELQTMILSKLTFYAKFNDIGSDMWENGVVLSGRSSSGSYTLTVKDILGNLVKNTHVHSQLRSMLPSYKFPKGKFKRSEFKGKQIVDLGPSIQYALESDSLKLLGNVSLESLTVSTFQQIWERIVNITRTDSSGSQNTSELSEIIPSTEIETSIVPVQSTKEGDISQIEGKREQKSDLINQTIEENLSSDPALEINESRHKLSFEQFYQPSLTVKGSFIPIYSLSHQIWNTNIPISAEYTTTDRKINGVLSSYEKHRIAYSILQSIQELEDTTLFSQFNNIIMNFALEARYIKELLDSEGLTLSEFKKDKSSRYTFAIENWLTKKIGHAIHPDDGSTIGEISVAQYLDINSNLRLPKQDVNSTGRDFFTALYSIIRWEPLGNEKPDEVYGRLRMQLKQNNYNNLFNDKITDNGLNSFEAFQVLSDVVIGKLLSNYLLSLKNEDLANSNEHLWSKIPSRYLKYDFRTSREYMATNDIGNGSDLIILGPRYYGIIELKSWAKSFTMGRGYSDIAGITYLEDGIIKRRSYKNIPPYTENAGSHKLSISGFGFGTDKSSRINQIYNLPDWVQNLVRDKIIYPWGMQGQDPVYARLESEYTYSSMLSRAILKKQSQSPLRANEAPTVIWEPKYPDAKLNPIIQLVSSPALGDFGISLIDRLGRNWKNWYLGYEWHNPGDKWGPKILTLGRHLNNYEWDTGINLVRNKNGAPSINLLNSVAIRLYEEPYSYSDEKSGQLYNPKMNKGSRQYDRIYTIARKLLSFAEHMIHLAIFEHLLRTKQLIDINEKSIIHKQLGVTLGNQKAIENAINDGEMEIHNMYVWEGITPILNPDNEYKTKIWIPDGRIIESHSHDSARVVLHGRMVEEPGSGKINKFGRKEYHGFLGLRRDQMLAIPARIAKIVFDAYTIDIWKDLESLYAMVPGSKLQRTNELAELKFREVELLLQTYQGLDQKDKLKFRATKFESRLGIPIDGILKTGENEITNSIALWRMMPHEFRVALTYELGKSFTNYNTQGLVSNWSIDWDNPDTPLVFKKTIRGLEMTGGILPELLRDRNQRIIHEPGTIDRYDMLNLRPEADIANYGYLKGPKDQRFSDKGFNRVRAIAFNKIAEIHMEKLYSEVPNYWLGLKSLKETKLDFGMDTQFFKNKFKSLIHYLEECLKCKLRNEEIPKGIQGKILNLIRTIIHAPEDFKDLTLDGYAAEVVLPNHMKSGLVRIKDRTFRKTYGFRISDPEQFMRMSSDFWTFTQKGKSNILDFFDPNYKSAKEINEKLWEQIITGEKVKLKKNQLRMIKQFTPSSNKVHRRYNIQNKLIKPSCITKDGIIISRKKPFDGLMKSINPQDFPTWYFGEIVRLNSFLKRNPTPPTKGSIELNELIIKWSNFSLITKTRAIKGNSGTIDPSLLTKVLVSDIPELAELFAITAQLDDYHLLKIQNKKLRISFSLSYLFKRQKLDRYSDLETYGKIQELRDLLLRFGETQIDDSDFSKFFGSFWWINMMND